MKIFRWMIIASILTQLQILNADPEAVRPWLGVAIEEGKQGVRVKGVIAGTPAAKEDFQVGDEIVQIEKEKVTKPAQMIALVQSLGVGNKVVIEILRGGKKIAKNVALVARPDEENLLKQRLEGKAAALISAIDLKTGAEVDSNSLKGKVTLFEFWAPWCPACRQSHPRLSEFAQSAGSKVAVIGVSEKDEDESVKSYMKKNPVTFEVWSAKEAKTQEDYAVMALPTIVVVDREGVVRLARLGAGEYLEQAIKLAEELARK